MHGSKECRLLCLKCTSLSENLFLGPVFQNPEPPAEQEMAMGVDSSKKDEVI